jgi:hypothetical protein
MQTHELLNRLELLYPNNSSFSDLRRAFIDNDRNSMYRVLQTLSQSQLIEAIRKLEGTEGFNEDCLSQGQIQSKTWLVETLKTLDVDLGIVFLCAGWYATLATMIFESDIQVNKIRSFDIDDSCRLIAETFNKPWVLQDWKFKTATYNILDIDYSGFTYNVFRSDGTACELHDAPDTVINTSCEHIENFDEWYNKIPNGKLVILQSNNYFEIEDHVNCVRGPLQFAEQAPMSECLYQGAIELPKYTRFMRIGYK